MNRTNPFQVCESFEQEGEVSEPCAKSYIIPVYKGKGDIFLEKENFKSKNTERFHVIKTF